jgi:hypothetical protein
MKFNNSKSVNEHLESSEVLDCPQITAVGNGPFMNASSPFSNHDDSVKDETSNDGSQSLDETSEEKQTPVNSGLVGAEHSGTTTESTSPSRLNDEPSRSAPTSPSHEPIQERIPHPLRLYGHTPSEYATEQNMTWSGSDSASYPPRPSYNPANATQIPSHPRDAVDHRQLHSYCTGVTYMPQGYYIPQYPLPGYIRPPDQRVIQTQETLGRPHFLPGPPCQINLDNQLSGSAHLPNRFESHSNSLRRQGHCMQNTQGHLQGHDPHAVPRSACTHQPPFGEPYHNQPRLPEPMHIPCPTSTVLNDSNEISHGGLASNCRQACARNKSYRNPEKKYKCEFCSMGFERPSSLKVHRRKHTRERPFLCDECKKSFTTASNLTRHRRRLHIRENPSLEGSPDLIDTSNQGRSAPSTLPDRSVVRGSQPIIECCAEGSIRFGADSIQDRTVLNLPETSFQRQPFANDRSQYHLSHGRSTDQSQTCSRASRHNSDDSNAEEGLRDHGRKAKRKKRRRRSDEMDEG